MTLALSLIFFYGIAQIISYAYVHEKLEKYAESILTRSNSLISQVKEIDALRNEFAVYSPCSDQYLHSLRKRLWPYPLIKDISYIKDDRVICSALWGKFTVPLSLNVFRNKVDRAGYTWIFDAMIEEGITADILYTDNFAITVSPFAFQRFWEDADKMNFNAIVGDNNHESHFFRIGKDINKLEAIEHGREQALSFILIRACNSVNDICVIAGTQLPFFFYGNVYALVFLLSISLVIGLLVSALIINNLEKNQSLLSRLEYAIDHRKLHFVYQPIYRVKNNSLIGIEALIRWNDDKVGNIGPDIFIPLAEQNGLINKIGLYVVENSIKECASILQEHAITLSINVSCSDICSELFRQTLVNTMQKEGISGGSLMLEITERQSASIEEIKQSVEFYQSQGILFALDDFGTGYSNLSWLSLLDVDEIKIDKSLTDSIGTESINKHILPGLIGMFRNMPRIVVFEGVENELQYQFLKENLPECCAQGWYFSRAVELTGIEAILRDDKA
ncbi:sensor c-di-GMP phosphodiesterase, contains CSS-motif sensor and EAL domain [Kosakonia oryzendophytica]|uniref:cyclic-guanylate-specific phosphodiesterase n=1 Tax=Kosakonia oryzendophytica TaxID=1005665 RepID=A0A1C4ATL8_9ENTR|nr:EAL domain-containing protein [Kosakonia oryzendophytica]WBT57350.1 EAL domain-containing protein [Kosakonia oryzendophytica]SCB97846.1 sensor c-di-GMP phosphodiesterase, contains CSS-motif sensor and EAL domain [Kosakonia oryzendophytica]